MNCACRLLFTAAVTCCLSCGVREGAPERVAPLPRPQTDAKPSPYRPEVAFESLGPGIASRQLFSARSDRGVQVDVREVLVGPGQKSERVTLPGAALIEVRSGVGTLTAGDRAQEVRLGATLLLAQGEGLSLANSSDVPLTLRIHVFRAE